LKKGKKSIGLTSVKILVIAILSITTLSSQELSVEPPNWWYGLQSDTVQLMLHGNKINHLKVSLEKQNGGSIKSISKSDNPNYLWVTLDLSKVSSPTNLDIILSEKRKERFTISYQLKAIEDNSASGFDQSDAIYLITPDRFANANSSNDNIEGFSDKLNRQDPSGRHGGDLQGIQDQIDYISDLGFTAIWLNPIIENNNPRYSYHGYGATDFYQVDRRFGTNTEYKLFVQTCHDKGIKVIMDMIHNHCSDNHPWMADLPTYDWLNTWKSYTETNHKKSTLQDIYAAEVDKKTYVDGWFVPTMPDLNQRNSKLATYLIQNSIWWSLYLGLDGIRMDTYSYPDKTYMKDWVDALHNVVPSVSIVGEEWTVNPAHIAYWQKGKVNPDGFESNLEYLMDFPTNQVLAAALTEEESWDKGIIKLYESISNDFQYPNPENLLVFPDNHDMVRAYTSLGEDLDLMKTATIFCLTTRGVPQLYYGTEILMTSPPNRDDGKIRADYPGGWEGDQVNAFTSDGLTTEQIEFREFVKTILHWRKSSTTMHEGRLIHYTPMEGVYVYFREKNGETVMVILNKNAAAYQLEMSRFEQMIGDSKSGLDILSNEVISLGSHLELGPKKSYIFQLH
jgi:glycosidase